MFTGLVEEQGKIKSIRPDGGGFRISVSSKIVTEEIKIDDSVAINGVCQTVVACSPVSFEVVAVEETLRKTTFRKLRAGDTVNLERALKLNARLGGHIVQGHIDCIGKVYSIQKERTAVNVWISFPQKFAKYLVNSGSICVDGISLTSARVEQDRFMLAIIPHTWENTTFNNLKAGDSVNLEFDILGKYIENMIAEKQNIVSENRKSSLDRFIEQPEY